MLTLTLYCVMQQLAKNKHKLNNLTEIECDTTRVYHSELVFQYVLCLNFYI